MAILCQLKACFQFQSSRPT